MEIKIMLTINVDEIKFSEEGGYPPEEVPGSIECGIIYSVNYMSDYIGVSSKIISCTSGTNVERKPVAERIPRHPIK